MYNIYVYVCMYMHMELYSFICVWRMTVSVQMETHTHTCTHTYTYIYIYMYTYTIDKYPCGDHKLVSNVWNCNVPPRLRKIPREYLYLCQVNGRRSIFFHAWTGAPSCVDAEPRLQRGGPDHLPTAGQWGRGGTSNVVKIINWLITTGWKP